MGALIANFAAFFIASLWLGGSATNGMIEGGKYYLGQHNTFTEVSKQVFSYSQIHERMMIVGHVAALGLLMFAKVREMTAQDTDD